MAHLEYSLEVAKNLRMIQFLDQLIVRCRGIANERKQQGLN